MNRGQRDTLKSGMLEVYYVEIQFSFGRVQLRRRRTIPHFCLLVEFDV
jgi:hypothetical protein